MKDKVKKYLDELFPNAHCELVYRNHFELLLAIVLSAQTTDVKVNSVTPTLFSKYPTPSDLANANLLDVVEILKPLGLANNKAKNIIATSKILKDIKIPTTREELVKLPGVGRKTANVFLAEGLKQNAFAVDTHVSRVSNRLGISNSSDPLIIEKDLTKLFDEDDWVKLHHQMIFFGRYFCKAKNPNCKECKLKEHCNF